MYLLSIYFIFSSVYWENINYYLRYTYLIAIIIGITANMPQFENISLFSYHDILQNIDVMILLPVFIVLIFNYILSRYRKDVDLDLLLPFKEGTYLIAEGGDGKRSFFSNYHYKFSKYQKWKNSMRYAVDMVQVNRLGFTMNGFISEENEKYYIYKEKVHSLLAGVVSEVVDSCADNIPYSGNYQYGTGNHEVIKKDNYYVLLGHLKSETINVYEGQFIEQGEYIGQIGNSGYSNRPHLHMQVVHSEDKGFWSGMGVPFTLNGKFPVKNIIMRV